MPHAALCVLGQGGRSKQSFPRMRFNAARSIVCVGTNTKYSKPYVLLEFQCRTQHCVCWDPSLATELMMSLKFQCRTQHCVCWDDFPFACRTEKGRFNAARSIVCVGTVSEGRSSARRRLCFNAARSIVCVGTSLKRLHTTQSLVSMPHAALCVLGLEDKKELVLWREMFQCRTQHCVCWDIKDAIQTAGVRYVSMPHAALCVLGLRGYNSDLFSRTVSMPHAALCVLGQFTMTSIKEAFAFQCRTQHCVCWDKVGYYGKWSF